MKKNILLTCLVTLALIVQATAQPRGTIRGTVSDAASEKPLPYVAVAVLQDTPVGVVTDSEGAFTLPPLTVGRYDISVTFLGYEPALLRGVMVSSSKETVLEVSLQESVLKIEQIEVRAHANKEEALNSMALVGGRVLSIEDASRYAGGMDDPARLVSSFAGAAGETGSNAIAIRGNSPQFLQWKLEGVEIPNPSHYPEVGAVGGGILTAFSSQVLGNSDFFSGAFPAEYNNALSGVFDMNLRNGNNQRWEHTAQVGSLGVEFASEGPFKRGGKSSYLFNYRYSALALVGSIFGGEFGRTAGGMRYQDLSFKVNLPTRRAGIFSIWGIGTHDRYIDDLPDDLTDFDFVPTRSEARQQMGAAGAGHKILLGGDAYLKSTLAATYSKNHMLMDLYDTDLSAIRPVCDFLNRNTNLVLQSFLNKKFSARHTNRTGFTLTGLFYDNYGDVTPDRHFYSGEPMQNFMDADGSTLLASVFSQSLFQFSERWSGEAGLNAQYFALNSTWTVEPRLSARWRPADRHAISAAVGLHSRHERLDYYFVEGNKNLGLTKAAHLVLSYKFHITPLLHFQIEPYFQYLYDVPVEAGTGFSIINQELFFMDRTLVNRGKGRNIGVDITLERYLKDGYYFLFTASAFDSRYTGGDGVWRNTRFNRHFVLNALGGKEWVFGRNGQHAIGFDIRLNLMGGAWFTPMDEAQSLIAHEEVKDESRMMGAQDPVVFVMHASLNYRLYQPKVTHEIGFKMLNITGSDDYHGYEYNVKTHQMEETSATVSIPNIYYKISF